MEHCLRLAKQGQGGTSPNPLVGCVIVKDGVVVGEGYHKKAGGPHAEVWALQAAGDRAVDATLYVNLEPCCYYGRTPPCTEAIIRAGIGRVVIGMEDPNPKVAGMGVAQLESAGIQVTMGICEAEAKSLNEIFIKFISKKQPFVLWKAACSLDGKIAVANGDARWVTGAPARAEVHRTRAYLDGILVGSGTVLMDDPLLTVRPLPDGRRQPVRIVLDGRGRIPATAKVFNSLAGGHTIWVVGQGACVDQSYSGDVSVLYSPEPTIDLAWLVTTLGQQGITSLLLEGGPTVAASFWQAQLIDKVQFYLAPKLIGQEGIAVLGNLGNVRMSAIDQLQAIKVRTVGDDICIEAYPNWVRL